MKISAKLFIIVSCLSAIALLVVGMFSFISTKSTLQKYIGNNQRDIAEKTMETIDRLMYERYLNIQDISQSQTIEGYLLEQNSQSREKVQRRLEKYKTITGPWDFINITDKTGKIILSTNPNEVGTSLGVDSFDDAPIRSALTGQIAYSDAHIDRITGKLAIIFAAPIKDDASGKLLGVATGHLSWPVVAEIIYNIQSPLIAHLYNKEGVVIVDSGATDQQEIFKENLKANLAVQSALKGEEGYLIGSGINHQTGGQQDSLVSYVTEDGYLGFFGNGWVLTVEQPTAIAFAPATTASWRFVFIIGGIVLVSVFGILFTLRRNFLRPLVQLTAVVEDIGKGNLARRASVGSKDEIGILGRTVNQMAASLWDNQVKLQEYSKGLEEKISEKTKDLQNKVDELNKAREAVLNIAEDAEEEKQRTIREKDKIDAILHSIGDGVFVVDKNLIITIYNQIAANISGFGVEEAIGKRYNQILKFVFETDGQTNDKFIKDSMATGEIKEMTNHTVLIRKDGSKVAVADSAAPLKDKNGAVTGCVVVFRDVTKEREIDKAKTEFVSLASHQLRTPLSSINWYTEMLLAGDAGKINEEQKKYLDEIYHGNQRMVDLVNALLNVSRLELGTFMVEPEPVDVAKLAQSVADEQKPQIKVKNITLDQKYGDTLPTLNADPKLLRMLIQNLLSNAVKYTPDKGTIHMDIRLVKSGEFVDKQKAGQDSIGIVISDTGYGITKGQQDKIFSKLFRADNVREKDTEGTGLGLYIVKAIVDHSGGKIWFESEENKGTTFYLTLPLTGMKKKEGTKAIA